MEDSLSWTYYYIVLSRKSWEALVDEILQQNSTLVMNLSLGFILVLIGVLWFRHKNQGLVTASTAYNNFVHWPKSEAAKELSSLTAALIDLFLCVWSVELI